MSTAIAERDDQTDQNPAALVQLAVKSGANVEQPSAVGNGGANQQGSTP